MGTATLQPESLTDIEKIGILVIFFKKTDMLTNRVLEQTCPVVSLALKLRAWLRAVDTGNRALRGACPESPVGARFPLRGLRLRVSDQLPGDPMWKGAAWSPLRTLWG